MRRAIGVDIGGTKLRAGMVDACGRVEVVEQSEMPRSADAIPEVLVDTISAAMAAAGEPGGGEHRGAVEAIGVGAAGLVDVGAGVVRFAPNIGYRNFPVVDLVRSKFGLRVTVDNDATAACYGEYRLTGDPGMRNMVLVTLGTGIGGGMVLDGRLYRGSVGFAGDIGHILIDPLGPMCGCGQRGCWETFASGSALGEMGKEAARAGKGGRLLSLAGGEVTRIKGEHVVEAARGGDATSLEIMGEYAERVALGLVVLANVLDPDVFVIGGGVSEASDLFLDRTSEAFALRLQGRPYREPTPLRRARLGRMAGIIGAALIALGEDEH